MLNVLGVNLFLGQGGGGTKVSQVGGGSEEVDFFEGDEVGLHKGGNTSI